MASVKLQLSKRKDNEGESQLKLKLTVNRHCRYSFDTGLYIEHRYFKTLHDGNGHIYGTGIESPKLGKESKDKVTEVSQIRILANGMENRYVAIAEALDYGDEGDVSKDSIEKAYWLTRDVTVSRITYDLIEILHEKRKANKGPKKSFEAYFNEFIEKHPCSKGRKRAYRVLLRGLLRFQAYVREFDKERSDFTLDIDTLDKATVDDFFIYFEHEASLVKKHPDFFKKVIDDTHSHTIKVRSSNYMVDERKRFKTFWKWLIDNEYTINNPVKDLKPGEPVYGTPYYISIDERNKIANTDLTAAWKLQKENQTEEKADKKKELPLSTLLTQRDIFVFQCEVGCRVSDLVRFTEANVENGILSYIAKKTKNIKGTVINIPLTQESVRLVEKYRGVDPDGKLFPFISPQKYDMAIKQIFRLCGITHNVTIRDPKTGEEREVPICNVASSHLARRTFIGNLYNKVPDPNIICSMTGHSENSKAFARYRVITMEVKRKAMQIIA